MSLEPRIETAMTQAIALGQGRAAPPRLASALNYAVTPGGARIRPTILLSVASACGDDRPEMADAAAVALELIHCASLVHDDMPCFDDADIRRGKPRPPRLFGAAGSSDRATASSCWPSRCWRARVCAIRGARCSSP